MTEDRDKWRKYIHSVANPRIEDGYRTEQISLTHRVLYIRQHYYWLQTLKCQKPSYLVEIGDKYLYIYAKYQNKFSTKLWLKKTNAGHIHVLCWDIWADILIKELENQRNAVGKHQMLTHVLKLYSSSQQSVTKINCSIICKTSCQSRLVTHRHRIDKSLDTVLANQTARKALPLTTAKSRNRKMADCPSYY